MDIETNSETQNQKGETKEEEFAEYTMQELGLTVPVKGHIVYRYIKCGRKKCQCSLGPAYYHGPYPHLEWQENNTRKTKYLNKRVLKAYKQAIDLTKAYKAEKKEKGKDYEISDS